MGYIRNFIETVLELPWTQRTEDNLEIKAVKKALDEEHYALDKVKQRILECVAVMKLTGKVSSQILCLVGPPGVGKTSIAESIAKAMGENLSRFRWAASVMKVLSADTAAPMWGQCAGEFSPG